MRVSRQLTLLFLAGLAETSTAQSCIQDISEIYEKESKVTDTSVHRTYYMCPRRIYEIGKLDFDLELKGFQVHPPFPIRPNMSILCGDTGSREETCWIADGDVHIDATPFRGITDGSVENVLIQGFIFISAKKYSLWATKPGDITFRDCEFRVRRCLYYVLFHRDVSFWYASKPYVIASYRNSRIPLFP